ncbi:hypothetical protein [Methanobacterium paludis]|uniref:Uncharacterized protein n=1 Tax=Methanobacterium paludis (strain DSM 25820 / JCM 18151 / SWAN1) TaxID=868131 RepID=F6D577_METPW|nr:hypothetical protein [Methanobacterium paludis]AEG18185.1 hypothetical protein MSWAN_1168 [Methanobacterium paludis]
MVKDKNKIQDGTLNGAGTTNTELEFDARKVGNIFADFDRAVKTIKKYMESKKVKGEAYGFRDERNKMAQITVVLKNKDDFKTVEHEIREQLRMRRQQMTAYNVEVDLIFETNVDELISEEVVEWD